MTTTSAIIDPRALRNRLKAILAAVNGKPPSSSGGIHARIGATEVSIYLNGPRFYVTVHGPGISDTRLDYTRDFHVGEKMYPGMSWGDIDKKRDVPFKLSIEGDVLNWIAELERDPTGYAQAWRAQNERDRQARELEYATQRQAAQQEKIDGQLRLAAENAVTIEAILAHVDRIRRLSTVSAQLTDRMGGSFRMPSAARQMFIPHDQGTILCTRSMITDAKTVRPFFHVQCKGIYCSVTTDGLKATGTAKALENLRNRLAAVSDPFTAAKRVGRCFFCFRELTDEVSRHYGYGPDCAIANEGLPYDREVLTRSRNEKAPAAIRG